MILKIRSKQEIKMRLISAFYFMNNECQITLKCIYTAWLEIWVLCWVKNWDFNCCVFWPANSCVCMVENDQKHLKMSKKSTFFIMHMRGTWEAYEAKRRQKVCWSAIGSDSQKLVDTLKLVAHLEFCCFLYFFIFLREPYVSLSCAWWKRYFYWLCLEIERES